MTFRILMKTSKVKSICGFTLVELLLVLVLIAISVSTIAPRIGESVYGWQVREISKNMLATIRLAKQIALTKQEIILFVLDTSSDSFTIKRTYAASLHDTSNEFWVPRQFLGKDVKMVQFEGFKEVGSEKILVFWPDGRTETAHIIMIAKKDSEETQWHIYVENDGSAVLQEVFNK